MSLTPDTPEEKEPPPLFEFKDQEPFFSDNNVLENLKKHPGYVTVDPRILQAYAESISHQNGVGYFLKDMASQTDETVITDLNNMISIIQSLLKEITVIKRNLLFAKQLLHADYDSKVSGKAMDLYCFTNSRLAELEKIYDEKLEVVRRSYKTQLMDALRKIGGQYKKYYADMLALETGHRGSVLQDLKDTVASQGKTINDQEKTIKFLREQLSEAECVPIQEQTSSVGSEFGTSMISPLPPLSPVVPTGVDPERHQEVVDERNKLKEANAILEVEAEQQHAKVKRLEARIKLVKSEFEEERQEYVKTITEMKKEVLTVTTENNNLQAKTASEKKVMFVEKPSPARPPTPAETAETEEVEIPRTFSVEEVNERIKEEVQKIRTEITVKYRKESEALRQKSLQDLKLEHDKRVYAEKLLKSQQDLNDRDSGKLALRHLEKLEEEQRAEIGRLNKQIDRLTCIYEKKLSVLHSTMLNLKNELFLRNTLHRQAANLHQATLTYASDGPRREVFLTTHEHAHKRFPERLPPFKVNYDTNRPNTVNTDEASEAGAKSHSVFITDQGNDDVQNSNSFINSLATVK